jgi:hypothetical protein
MPQQEDVQAEETPQAEDKPLEIEVNSAVNATFTYHDHLHTL